MSTNSLFYPLVRRRELTVELLLFGIELLRFRVVMALLLLLLMVMRLRGRRGLLFGRPLAHQDLLHLLGHLYVERAESVAVGQLRIGAVHHQQLDHLKRNRILKRRTNTRCVRRQQKLKGTQQS